MSQKSIFPILDDDNATGDLCVAIGLEETSMQNTFITGRLSKIFEIKTEM